MLKMVHASSAERLEFDAKFGKWGQLPPNMKEIPEEEFWLKFLTYSPSAREYRQIHQPSFRALMIYTYNDDTGLVLEEQNKTRNENRRPKFYSCAICVHEYDWVHKGNCYREGTCTKCGHKTSIDSSD